MTVFFPVPKLPVDFMLIQRNMVPIYRLVGKV